MNSENLKIIEISSIMVKFVNLEKFFTFEENSSKRKNLGNFAKVLK